MFITRIKHCCSVSEQTERQPADTAAIADTPRSPWRLTNCSWMLSLFECGGKEWSTRFDRPRRRRIFSAPPHLMSSFSTQSLNFVLFSVHLLVQSISKQNNNALAQQSYLLVLCNRPTWPSIVRPKDKTVGQSDTWRYHDRETKSSRYWYRLCQCLDTSSKTF